MRCCLKETRQKGMGELSFCSTLSTDDYYEFKVLYKTLAVRTFLSHLASPNDSHLKTSFERPCIFLGGNPASLRSLYERTEILLFLILSRATPRAIFLIYALSYSGKYTKKSQLVNLCSALALRAITSKRLQENGPCLQIVRVEGMNQNLVSLRCMFLFHCL
jgi:hypothetical protein